MIKKIKIIKENKTIPEDFDLGLQKMTIITGENNTGKTNFIKTLVSKDKKGLFDKAEFIDENDNSLIPNIVYIEADNINPANSEVKSSAKTTGLVKNLSALFSNLSIEFQLNRKEEIIDHIKNLIIKTNENLENFSGHKRHKLKVDTNENELDSSIIIQALINDIVGDEDGEERALADLGQGTQRVIVASILKSYIDILLEKNINVETPILIIFEEPEIYLHPRLKKTLNATLQKISQQDNHQVIIITHDPYFAYTNLGNEDSIIYSFSRNIKTGYTDKSEPNIIFGIEDELLHIHLFEKVLRKIQADGIDIKDMDETSKLNKYLEPYCNNEKRNNIFPSGKTHSLSLPLHIRHVIHHPGDINNRFNEDDLEKSIKILNDILSK